MRRMLDPVHTSLVCCNIVRVPPNIDSVDDLIDFYAEILGLDELYSRNWNAFEECMRGYAMTAGHATVLAHEDVPLANDPMNRGTYLAILYDLRNVAADRAVSGMVVVFPRDSAAELEATLNRFEEDERSGGATGP